jgi:hypothetical protein
MMSKYVMVNAISMFSMKYCVEVPDEMENKDLLDHVEKQVSAGDTLEFTQRHMGEKVSDYRVVTKDEILEEFRSEEPYFASWDDDMIMRQVTPAGFNREEYEQEEERQWRLNTN